MPYTIKPGSFKYKKSNGQFSEIDCFEGPDLTEEVAALEKGKAPIIIDSATGNPIMIKDGADGLPVESMKIHFSPIQSGTGDPSPSNIRPISGWSGLTAWRTGVNLWDEEWVVGAIKSNGDIDTSETSRRTTSFIPVSPNTKYFQSSPSNAYYGRVAYYNRDKECVYANVSSGITTGGFTTGEDTYFVRATFGNSYGTTYNHDISFNYPSDDTE